MSPRVNETAVGGVAAASDCGPPSHRLESSGTRLAKRQAAVEDGQVAEDAEAAVGAARGALGRGDDARGVDLGGRRAAHGPSRAADDRFVRRLAGSRRQGFRVVDPAEQEFDLRRMGEKRRRKRDTADDDGTGERASPGFVESDEAPARDAHRLRKEERRVRKTRLIVDRHIHPREREVEPEELMDSNGPRGSAHRPPRLLRPDRPGARPMLTG